VSDGNALVGPGAGFNSGRIQPVNYTPVDGDYVLCIGSDELGLEIEMAIGDSAAFEQSINLTNVTLVTFSLRFRQVVNTTLGIRFIMFVYIDTKLTKPWQLNYGEDDQVLDFVQRTINVHSYTGVRKVGFAIEAIST
jgi:hypothetical protein